MFNYKGLDFPWSRSNDSVSACKCFILSLLWSISWSLRGLWNSELFQTLTPSRGKPRVGIVMSHVWNHHFVHFAILTHDDNDCLVAQTKFADSLSQFQPQNIVQIWFIGRWWRSRASEGSHMQQQKRVKIHSNQNSIWASARKNKCKKMSTTWYNLLIKV